MSARRMGLICWCLVAASALYASAAQAQAFFPTIYPKWYTVDCQGKTCGAASCSASGPFVDLATVGVMNFTSSTAGNGSAETNVADGAEILAFSTAKFTFTAVNGTGAAEPAANCIGAACVPQGCATVTETFAAPLSTTSTEVLCFRHNGAEFSAVGTKVDGGSYVCHGAAMTQ